MFTIMGSLFMLGFAIGITKPMVDHAESEADYWNSIITKYEGSGSR